MPSSRTHIASNVAPITALAGHSKMDGQAAGQAPLCVDFTATMEELNLGNSMRHMGVREATAVHTCVQGTICTDADELHALT